jgi:periplasmic mercuric ion binding protein
MRTNSLKYIVLVLALALLGTYAVAQKAGKAPKAATVVVHTSANCDQCKTTIETALGKVKGIQKTTVDLTTRDATVVYSPKKIDANGVRKAITLAGYDADDLKADQEAHDNLPACCRKGGHD